jgi:hypothetical protein
VCLNPFQHTHARTHAHKHTHTYNAIRPDSTPRRAQPLHVEGRTLCTARIPYIAALSPAVRVCRPPLVGRGMLWRTIGRHRIWQVEVRELASTALAAMLRLHDEAVLLGLHREFSEWARTKVCMCMCSFEWMMRVHGLGRCTRARVSRHAHR